MKKPHNPAANAGFSLLEILVAFSILALSLGVLLRIFAGGSQIAVTSGDYSRAILTAESLMASLGYDLPLQPGVFDGHLAGDVRWHLDIHPYALDTGLTGDQKLGFSPYWVELTVEWGDAEDPRAFSLTTLRLIPDKTQSGDNG